MFVAFFFVPSGKALVANQPEGGEAGRLHNLCGFSLADNSIVDSGDFKAKVIKEMGLACYGQRGRAGG